MLGGVLSIIVVVFIIIFIQAFSIVLIAVLEDEAAAVVALRLSPSTAHVMNDNPIIHVENPNLKATPVNTCITPDISISQVVFLFGYKYNRL